MQRKTREVLSSYDLQQKQKLVELGQSNKSYKDILVYLNSEITKSTQMTEFHYEIPCFFEDGVYQLNKAIEEIYGASFIATEEGGPSKEKENVKIISVQTGPNEIVKVPMGKISMPELGEEANVEITYNHSSNILYFRGCCEFRYSSLMDEIFNKTKKLINTESIYKSQAFEVTSSYGGNLEVTYLNLDGIDKQTLILSDKLQRELKPLTARIMEPEKCIEKGIPLKYGMLLSGKYGTGKTLAAFKLAKDAIRNNWTFIYLKDPAKLATVLKLCKTIDNSGHGVIIFTEDIDQVTRGERNARMQDILNTLDGGDTKDMNVIALFTTNHLELIEPTFLRGKRIGSIVEFEHLDKKTANIFLQNAFFKPTYKLEEEGLEQLCEYIEQKEIVPAFMAEIIESVKAYMVFEDDNFVKLEYIYDSVNNYLRQVELSKKKENKMTSKDHLYKGIKDILTEAVLDCDIPEETYQKVSEYLD